MLQRERNELERKGVLQQELERDKLEKGVLQQEEEKLEECCNEKALTRRESELERCCNKKWISEEGVLQREGDELKGKGALQQEMDKPEEGVLQQTLTLQHYTMNHIYCAVYNQVRTMMILSLNCISSSL